MKGVNRDMTFGEFLSSIRKEKGISQAQLAKHLQVAQSSVSRWEADVGAPDTATIRRIADKLGVDAGLLLNIGGISPVVIVVEDIRLLMRDYLNQLTETLGWSARCSGFQRASEALRFARECTVDVAFLDIELFDANGTDLAEQLAELNPRVNIVYLTGHPEYALKAVSGFCSGYVLKPLTPDKIREQLAHLRYPVWGLGS